MANDYDESKVSPRPWKTILNEFGFKENIRDSNGRCLYETSAVDNANHIVACVNTHDTLTAEVARLTGLVGEMKESTPTSRDQFQRLYIAEHKLAEERHQEIERLTGLVGELTEALRESDILIDECNSKREPPDNVHPDIASLYDRNKVLLSRAGADKDVKG